MPYLRLFANSQKSVKNRDNTPFWQLYSNTHKLHKINVQYSLLEITQTSWEGHSAWDTAAYAALTFAIDKTGSTYTVLSVIDSAGTITNIGAAAVDTGVTYSSISSSLVNKNSAVSEAYFYTGAWTADSLKQLTASTLQAKLVPEPTTATLSLLALAGLAARRRRR